MSEETDTKAEAVAVDVDAPQDPRGGKPSASGMARIFACPGSWVAEQLCGGDTGSDAAAHGTMLHECMEWGTEPDDPEDADAVQWCRDAESGLERRFLGEPGKAYRELRFWDAESLFSGQCDKVTFSADGKTALVLDYKFGRVPVDPAEKNCQLAAMASLIKDNFPAVEVVYASILQPWVSRQEPRAVKYGADALANAAAAVRGAVRAAMLPGARLVPGDCCKYCRAAATCPAVECNLATSDAVQRWDALSPCARAELYRRAKMARKLADKIEAAVMADLKAGVELPGLKLGAGRSSFTITDAAGAFGAVSSNLGVTAEEFTACCKVSITALDKLTHEKLKERHAGQTVKASKEELRLMLEPYGETKTTAGAIKEMELLG